MGLAQLYQIRGRVGRSGRKAYAYFTFRRDKTLTDIAQKRLSAIREFTAFGSGFRIAMRDLQIRGAGSLLGHSQHGHMEAVGYDLYVKMLGQAIARAKGEPIQRDKSECLVDLRVDAFIPEKYIADGPRAVSRPTSASPPSRPPRMPPTCWMNSSTATATRRPPSATS